MAAGSGRKRWIVLTSDKRIRFNRLEVAEVMASGVREFVFSSGNLSGAKMGELLKVAMPQMRQIVSEQRAPFIARITQTGRVEVLFDNQGSVYQRKREEI